MTTEQRVVWIASYPRSGNTWVRFLLANILRGQVDSAAALDSIAPDIREVARQALASHSGFLKTHFLCSPALPLLERTAAAVYVVRQPADVLVSNYYYARRSADIASEELDRYVNSFLQHQGDTRWSKLGFGSWAENVRSWLHGTHPFPVILVRYEDLHADPERVAMKIASGLGLEHSQQSIRAAAANSSFERMRAIELADIGQQRAGIFFKSQLQREYQAGRRFMRSGVEGDGSRALTAAQMARVSQAFGPLIEELYP
jgi:hypothetical protein